MVSLNKIFEFTALIVAKEMFLKSVEVDVRYKNDETGKSGVRTSSESAD